MKALVPTLGAVAVAATVGTAAAGPVIHVSEPEAYTRADHVKSCNHYVNRARFKARGADAEFVVILADSCTAALNSLSSDNRQERARAAIFLSRLHRLRDTIIRMNMERLFGADHSPLTLIRGAKTARIEPVAHVTATGEYLIAHHMGLLEAREAWLDTGPSFAAAPGRKG